MMTTQPRKREGATLLPASMKPAQPSGPSSCGQRDAASALQCESCRYRCAADAKFCAKCGVKLKKSALRAIRTKLPSLEKHSRPSTVTSPARQADVRPGSPPTRSVLTPTAKKRPRVPAKNPARIASLDSTSERALSPLHDSTQDSINHQHATQPSLPPDRGYDLKLKVWMVSTRRLVESLLELKRRLDRPELEALDGAQFQSIHNVVHSLESELVALEPAFSLDRNLQAKCVAMLLKLKELHQSTQQRLMASINTLADSQHTSEQPRLQPSNQLTNNKIRDADLVIRGPDGKKIFFKARNYPTKSSSYEIDLTAPVTEQVTAPAPVLLPKARRQETYEPEDECDGDVLEPPPRSSTIQFVRSRWKDMLLLRVGRVDGRVAVMRLSECDELHQLVVDVYRPLISLSVNVTLPLEWLEFILPPLVTWYRVSEVRRYRAVEAHWSRCFDHVVRCLKWKAGNEISVCFPIQYRQARMFSFRSFAIFYGFLCVQLMPLDYSLKISFLNARTGQRTVLNLLEKQIVRTLRGHESYPERLVGRTTRKTLYAQVCEKLYFEYTSRGFELVFPGVKPKGSIRRHPQEISIKQHRNDLLEQERSEITALKDKCMQQAVVIARRRIAAYDERQRRLKKEKQESAAKRIQARTRGLVAKKQLRRKREEKRRAMQLQDLAAMLIQQKYRKRREAERQARAKQLQQRDVSGTRFRLCCRVNNTFAMAIVTLDEIDAAANALDCNVHLVHPVTFQTAQLRVSHADLLRLFRKSSFVGWSRREIVETLLKRHLDVFRSVKHNVLVLGLR